MNKRRLARWMMRYLKPEDLPRAVVTTAMNYQEDRTVMRFSVDYAGVSTHVDPTSKALFTATNGRLTILQTVKFSELTG